MSTDAAIVVDHVSKTYRLYHERNQSLKAIVMRGRRARYEEFQALDDVSFEVPTGTTFGIIGENGSGKSTMLKCMARILRPDGGGIVTNGRISALLELGAGFHPELSGRENVYLNGAILGLSRKQLDQRFDEIVEFAGVEHFIDSPVKNYSSGMYVRLGFAIAINVDPDILLVDEVLAVGDAEFQRRCTEKIDDFREEGRTIVVVSHSLELVQSLCSHAALLEHGRLVQVGPTAEVIDAYLNEVAERRASQGESTHRGSGLVRVERVEILDGEGAPIHVLRSGDPAVFRLHYHANEPIDAPVFDLAFHTVSGMHVSSASTLAHDLGLQLEAGNGELDLVVERVPFAPGQFEVGITVHNRAMTHHLDLVDRALRFTVVLGSPGDHDGGVVALGGKWTGRAIPTTAQS